MKTIVIVMDVSRSFINNNSLIFNLKEEKKTYQQSQV